MIIAGAVPITTYSSPAQISNSYIHSNMVDPCLSAIPKNDESTSGPMIHPEIIEQIINYPKGNYSVYTPYFQYRQKYMVEINVALPRDLKATLLTLL